MRIIAVANQKGGVGKTTVSLNLGAALARSGSRVLLIDNDPQGNLTSYAGVRSAITLDEVYVAKRIPQVDSDALGYISENLWILGTDSQLSGVEYYLMPRADKEFVLKNFISQLQTPFDYVIIDNPPSLSLLTINGLVAAQKVLLPVQLEFFSLEGIVLLKNAIDQLRSKNPSLELLGVVPNMMDERRKLNLEVYEALKDQLGEKVMGVAIHDSVKIAESSGHGKSIFQYASSSRPAKEFGSLAKEVERLWPVN